MNALVNATICFLSLKDKREKMKLSTRGGRYRHQADSLNNSLKSKKSSFKKNTEHENGPTKKYKRKSSQNKNSKSPKVLKVASPPVKQSKEKNLRQSETPRRQLPKKIKISLKSKSNGNLLASKNNMKRKAVSQQRSKTKSDEKETLNEKIEAGSVKRPKRKISILNEELKERLRAESVTRSVRKSFMERTNLKETLNNVPLTSTPIKQCFIHIQRCNDESVTTYNSRSKKQKSCNKTPILESLGDSTSCMLSMTLRPRRQTPCISETHTLENKKSHKRPPRKSKPVSVTKMNFKSFAGTATIDDLALSAIKAHKRKVKSEGFKIPAKNTLKRRRFVFNELNKANEDYEDDIYEDQQFDFFNGIRIDSDSDLSMLSVATPKLGVHVTPMIRKDTPVFRDCISPTEYAINRKVAEECQFRLKKRKNASSASDKTPVPEKKRLEFSRVIAGVQQKEKTIQRIMEGDTSDMENSYFSDGSRLN